MPRRRKDLAFEESLFNNMQDYLNLESRLIALTVGRFHFDNLPNYFFQPYLIKMMIMNVDTLFAKDDDLDRYLWYTFTLAGGARTPDVPGKLQDALTQNRVTVVDDYQYLDNNLKNNENRKIFMGLFDEFNIPYYRRIILPNNGYQNIFDDSNSVIIRSSYSGCPIMPIVQEYARKLYIISRTIDVNVNAQKTPIMVLCDEDQRLTMENMMKQYIGNVPFIFGDKNNIDKDSFKVLVTNAPFVADKLFELKANIWNEFLTFLGIYNININKKERLITDEIQRSMGGVLVARNDIVRAINDSFDQVNKKFGLDIKFTFGEDKPSEEEEEEIKAIEASIEGKEVVDNE